MKCNKTASYLQMHHTMIAVSGRQIVGIANKCQCKLIDPGMTSLNKIIHRVIGVQSAHSLVGVPYNIWWVRGGRILSNCIKWMCYAICWMRGSRIELLVSYMTDMCHGYDMCMVRLEVVVSACQLSPSCRHCHLSPIPRFRYRFDVISDCSPACYAQTGSMQNNYWSSTRRSNPLQSISITVSSDSASYLPMA